MERCLAFPMERCLALIVCLCLAVSAFAQQPEHSPHPFGDVIERFDNLGLLFQYNTKQASPALVTIRVKRNRTILIGRSRSAGMSEESGSGIVANIGGKTVILTNRHVIEEAERGTIEILTHDRRSLTPVSVTANREFDIAVIEVAEDLQEPARFGNSDHANVGDIVLAIGNPFGLERSVSMGIISAVERRDVPGANLPDAGNPTPRVGFLQTDAAVNPGSSGGMLLNLRGDVIGILTAIATQGGKHEGVAFVMPSNAVLKIAEQLVQSGTVLKPYVGLGFELTISPEERNRLGIDRMIGVQIDRIDPDSPAEQSGLQGGDVILQYNGIEVEDSLHMFHLVAKSAIGTPVLLQVNRNREMLDVSVTPVAHISR